MAKGKCTASTPVECIGMTAVANAVTALTLANANQAERPDDIMIIPVNGRNNTYFVFKVEQAAA